ncbi:MAG: hypothetical protein AB7J35_09790 [Dehalococcoidia bacterium]
MNSFIRAFRGLALGLSISFMNLIGVFLTLVVLGGLEEWTRMQFVGVFGLTEIATAFAFMFAPNIWRLPVIEAETSDRTSIRLAASVAFIIHWAGGAKAIAGVAMLAAAMRTEGLTMSSLNLAPLAFAVGLFVLSASLIAARWGVERPDIDVVTFVIRRPSHRDYPLPGMSISASVLQIVLGALTLPIIKVLSPSALYRPEFAPHGALLLATFAVSFATLGVALWVWRGRLSRVAPNEQQRLAEREA